MHIHLTGMQLLGARYYLPKLGRFLTPDPIGHAGGPNLYAYCEDSPLLLTDAKGTWPQVGDWVHRNITRPSASWFHALHTTFGFMTNGGSVDNVYGPSSWQTQDVMESAIGNKIMGDLRAASFLSSGSHSLTGSVGSKQAFFNSVRETSNGTQWQLGAVRYYAIRRRRVIDIHVLNTISFNSLFYHLPQYVGVGDHERGDIWGWGDSNVYQDFNWQVPVPSRYWRGMKK